MSETGGFLTRSRRHLVLSIFLLAVILRVLFLVHYQMIDTDSAYYGNVARLFAAGHWQRALDPYWPPLFPFLVSFFFRLGITLEAAGIAVSLFASAGMILTCYLLGRLLAGDRVGLAAAGLAAVHPRLIEMSQFFLTEPLYGFLTSAALALFCLTISGPAQRTKPKTALLFSALGFILSLAFLTRPEGFFFFLLIFFLSAFYLFLRPSLNQETSARRPAADLLLLGLLIVSFLLPSFPYIHRVTRLQGRLTLGEKAEANFYGAYRNEYQKAGISVELSDYASISGPGTARRPGDYHILRFIGRVPGKIILRMARTIPRALLDKIPSLMSWPLMLLALFGLMRRKRHGLSRLDGVFGLWILTPVILYSPLFLYGRFFTPALPPLIVWCGVGLEELRSLLPAKMFRVCAVGGVLLCLLGANMALTSGSPPILYKEAGLWLKGTAASPIIISGRKPETSFYAEAGFRPLKAQRIEDLPEFFRAEGVTHLIVEDYILPKSHPQLAGLLDPKNAPVWLTPIYSSTRKGHRLIIYEFKGRKPEG